MHQLVWNDGDPTSENRPEKLIKANYASLAEAKEQAAVDVAQGKNIVGILDEEGKMIWTAKGYAKHKNKRMTHSGEASYPWKFEDE